MPDLVTHLCTALLPAGLVGSRHAGLFAVGVAMPDLASRVPSGIAGGLYLDGWPVPRGLLYPWTVLHLPFGIAGSALLLSLLFPERDRPRALAWLTGGGLLHLAVDALQDHHGYGYALLFPLSWWTWEAGCIGTEATVPFAPWIALVTAAVWAARFAWERRRSPPV